MATQTRYADGDMGGVHPSQSFANWTRVSGNSGYYTYVDDGFVSPTDSAYWRNRGVTGDVSATGTWLTLQDGAADLDTLTQIDFRLRQRIFEVISISDPYDANFAISFWDDTGTVFYGSVDIGIADLAYSQTFVDTGFYSITGLSLTKAQTDAMTVYIYGDIYENGNSLRLELSEIEFVYTYTQISVAASDKHKMDIGLGFGPGFK